VSEEIVKVIDMRDRARSVVRQRLERESSGLTSLRARPALAAPQRLFDTQAARVAELAGRSRRSLDHRLARAADEVGHHLARVRGLSPRATLERGYSVITTSSGKLVTDARALTPGEQVEARLACGRMTATVNTSSCEHQGSDDG
jgi:exodeoxyribonuclease VII large subunit